jgi:hypothetical protein
LPLSRLRISSSNEGSPPTELDAPALGYNHLNHSLIFFQAETHLFVFESPQISSPHLLQGQWLTLAQARPSETPDQILQPPERSFAVAAVDRARNRWLLATGEQADGTLLNDLWSFDFLSLRWTELSVSVDFHLCLFLSAFFDPFVFILSLSLCLSPMGASLFFGHAAVRKRSLSSLRLSGWYLHEQRSVFLRDARLPEEAQTRTLR